MSNVCERCGEMLPKPDRVSVHGMFDMHLFHRYEGATVDELIDNWLEHIKTPIPAIVGDREFDDIGPTDLCPAIVLAGDKELRRVGPFVHTREDRKPDPDVLEEYRQALLSDPDIPRLLAERAEQTEVSA